MNSQGKRWIKRKKAPRKKTKRPMGVLKRKLDSAFAAMIRERDAGQLCISCQQNWGVQAGHFISRRILATRWHPKNVSGQCVACNYFRDGNVAKYAAGLEEKFGVGTIQTLAALSRTSWKPSREALEALLESAALGFEAYEETWEFYGAKG